MMAQRDLEVTEAAPGGMTPQEELALKNKRLGLNIFQISWIMVFMALIFVNWQLRYSYTQWPPEGVEPLNPLLPTLATLGLLLSGFLARGGLAAVRRDDAAAFLRRWQMALGLGLAFIAVMAYEFLAVSDAALATQYGPVFRVMTGFHAIHALAIGLLMLQVYRYGRAGSYHAGNFWAVEGAAKLWYFVIVAWILFYVVLYWI